MLSAIGAVLKPLMLFNGIGMLRVKFDCKSQAIEIVYTDRAGKTVSTVMPFSEIEDQVNGLAGAQGKTPPQPPSG